ncbi:MAG: hypothetical protein ACOC43_10005 [Desulfohalobiaceae bacterium]
MDAEAWIKTNTFWCETLQARISPMQCEHNRKNAVKADFDGHMGPVQCATCQDWAERQKQIGKEEGTMPSNKKEAACRECGEVKKMHCRGLCAKCYYKNLKALGKPGLDEKYPSVAPGAAADKSDSQDQSSEQQAEGSGPQQQEDQSFLRLAGTEEGSEGEANTDQDPGPEQEATHRRLRQGTNIKDNCLSCGNYRWLYARGLCEKCYHEAKNALPEEQFEQLYPKLWPQSSKVQDMALKLPLDFPGGERVRSALQTEAEQELRSVESQAAYILKIWAEGKLQEVQA